MAYKMRVRKKDGSFEGYYMDGDTRRSLSEAPQVARAGGVIVKTPHDSVTLYNFHPSRSKAIREKQIRDGLNAERAAYTSSRGFSKGKTMKKVASIPPEYFWGEKMERGPEALRDPKDIKKFCDKHQFNVSKW
jgi:hypothetical protein